MHKQMAKIDNGWIVGNVHTKLSNLKGVFIFEF